MKLLKSLITLAAVGGAAYTVYKKKDEILEKVEELKERDAPVIYSTDDEDHMSVYEEKEENVEVDTNDDGEVDVIGVDTTGDGQLDTALMDTDGDGKIDTIATTVDKPEYESIDVDGDGKADVIIIRGKEDVPSDEADSDITDTEGMDTLTK